MTTNDTNKTDSQTPTQTLPHPLAGIGAGELAYIRPVLAGEIADTVPQAKELPPGMQLFALHGAAGDPILLTTTRELAVAGRAGARTDARSVCTEAPRRSLRDARRERWRAPGAHMPTPGPDRACGWPGRCIPASISD